MVRTRSTRRVAGSSSRRTRSALLGTAAVAVLLLIAGCSGGSDDVSAASVTPEQTTSPPVGESVEATPKPTDPPPPATSTPNNTPSPTPTSDPLIVDAEEVAVAYFLAIHQIAADARNADASEAIRLEAEGGPLENYALRLINETLKANDHIDFDEIRWELVGSEIVNANVGAVDVFICMQSSGEWRDFDTDEVTKRASSEPFTFVYQVRSDGVGSSPKVWTFDDTDADGEVIPCEVSGDET